MGLLDARDVRRGELAPRLSRQGIEEQAAAHPDPPVDAPHRELEAHRLERLTPGEHVLVDAVDECAVEIEQEGGAVSHN